MQAGREQSAASNEMPIYVLWWHEFNNDPLTALIDFIVQGPILLPLTTASLCKHTCLNQQDSQKVMLIHLSEVAGSGP